MMSATTQSYIGHAAVMAGHSASISLTFFRLKKTKERPCDSESHVHLSDRRLTFLRLPVELLSKIFAFHFLTGFKYIDTLSQVSTQMRLVCRLWDAVIISTPSLWVQLRFDQKYSSRPVCPRIPPDILSIWLQRSETCPLHIELDCYWIDPPCFPVLTSSIERWESLMLFVCDSSLDLVCQHIPLSRARRLKSLCVSKSSLKTPERITAFIGTTPNLQSLCIQVEFCQHCATICSIASIVNNLSHLHLGGSALCCKCTWGMLRHFRGTLLDLSCYDGVCMPQDESPITLLNLKILRLELNLDEILQLLTLLDAPTLQVLDLPVVDSNNVRRSTIHLSQLKFPLLALRVAPFESIDDLYRFLRTPYFDIDAIPLVEVKLECSPSTQISSRQRCRCILGVAVWVEHWVLGTFVGWNRLSDVPDDDVAGYLFGEISCGCLFGSPPFLMFEEMTKVNSRISGNRCWSKRHKRCLECAKFIVELRD